MMTLSQHDDMDQQLRQWADQARRYSPRINVPDLDGPHGSGRRRVAVLFAAAAVVALALVLAITGSRTGRTSPGGPPTSETVSGSATSVAPVAGLRQWRSHGLAVDVPASWPLNALRCGTPIRDTVILDPGPVSTCSVVPIRGDVAWVQFTKITTVHADSYPFFQLRKAPTESVDIDGVSGFRSEGVSVAGVSLGRFVVILALPSRHIAVSVVAPDAALARRLADTAHLSPTPDSTTTSASRVNRSSTNPGSSPSQTSTATRPVHRPTGAPPAAALLHFIY